ncbi:MAG: selenocysteine-specific translation elongation factor [candidate division Zixibacteria bacterium]|nr:selenocysteine-specific translation elongation factor [candidate division Zixibacteria bacterium]
MYVMGTAGHVDHGKSTLVTALSGIDPDRLPEEKARGMTIDLGFAWMTTNSGETLGIVDVPGHERFVKNMIAGVGAIDFVLLVIAADDGWMPQTAEHLAILRFLRVPRGIVVITKRDWADPEWLELVKADVKDKIAGAFADEEHPSVVAVDSLSGSGMAELRATIDRMARSLTPRRDIGRPRLYIDRAFAMPGRGAVVTGTLIDGSLAVGETVAIVPGGGSARVRELQTHKAPLREAAPGQRLAVNLAGVDAAALSRGQCLVHPDDEATTDRLWTHVDLLPEIEHPLKERRRVLVMLGTGEPEAVAYPLGLAAIPPGGEGLCEFRLAAPIKARLNDHFVIRWPTPQVTIGGGTVLHLGGLRHLRRDALAQEQLIKRRDGTLATLRATELQLHGFGARQGFLRHSPFSDIEIAADLQAASDRSELIAADDWLFDPSWMGSCREHMLTALSQAHRDHPHLPGLNLAEWRIQSRTPSDPMPAMADWLVGEGTVARTGEAYHLPTHQPSLPAEWQEESARLWTTLVGGNLQPLTRDELEARSANARAIVGYWIAVGQVVSLGDGVIFPSETFAALRETVKTALRTQPSLTAGQLRDLLGTTRKYAVPIGEALDREGITRRVGDVRVLAEGTQE